MAEDGLNYERMAQEALRGVVRDALIRVRDAGALPGKHSFYITFKTKLSGVQLAEYLVEKYPDEMTIVLEHQFSDLAVGDRQFEVVLRFSGVPQRIVVPFGAITRFYDPSVRFGLQFDAVAPPAESYVRVAEEGESGPAVVSLDAFRRKK